MAKAAWKRLKDSSCCMELRLDQLPRGQLLRGALLCHVHERESITCAFPCFCGVQPTHENQDFQAYAVRRKRAHGVKRIPRLSRLISERRNSVVALTIVFARKWEVFCISAHCCPSSLLYQSELDYTFRPSRQNFRRPTFKRSL